jgi:mono/diheme cytochrome c family protein
MAGRPGLDPVEEGKSYSALFVLMIAVLLATTVWSIWDDTISRRPWKQYQLQWDRLAYDKYIKDAADEQKRLDADPEYQKVSKDLAAARDELHSGATAARLAALRAQLTDLKNTANDKDQLVRFTRSYLTERWYDYNHAIQERESPVPYKQEIDKLNAELAREIIVSDQARDNLQAVKDQIEALNSKVESLTDRLKKFTAKRDDFLDKADTWMIPVKFRNLVLFRYPKLPRIEQTAIDDFDRNAFDEAIARVDRCQSCHMGADKKGFENAPQPFRTHSNFDQIILKHPPDKLGCTPCHDGQGPAVSSVLAAHGDDPNWDSPMLRGDKTQSRCIKCHMDVGSLLDSGGKPIAANWVEGERLFEQAGCAGCHLVAGYEDMSKIGPYLKLAAAKLDPSWLVRWISDPEDFRRFTRMPDFTLRRADAVALAAFILDSSSKNSKDWRAAHPEPATLEAGVNDPALVEEGKGLFESVGCKGCHAIEPNQHASPVGVAADFGKGQTFTAKDFAPNLGRIAEKTSAAWIYAWLKNPHDFSPQTAMPSLRLTDHEAQALTAFLMTHGKKREFANLASALENPAQIKKGEALVRKYGCFGCHEIEGMDKESRNGVELTTFGSKHVDELSFGNRTQIPETWDQWTFHKLQSPRSYATRNVEQLMPKYHFNFADIQNLVVFLAGLTQGKVPEQYRMPGSEHQAQIVAGRQIVNYYNCVGCHVIENRGGYIRRLYPGDEINFAPPILDGEGFKVQPEWLFAFLQEPTPIRPWLKIRMPSFHLTNGDDNTIVNYFTALSDVNVLYTFIDTNLMTPAELAAGAKMMTKDYFNCFSCHQAGDKKPEGPPSGWAPDMALTHIRLNPEWVLKWIANPSALQPGTKMPSYYPGGPEDILGGNQGQQIRVLRDYIFWLGTHPEATPPAQTATAPVKTEKRKAK